MVSVRLDDAVVRDLIDHLRTPAAKGSPKEQHGHALRLYLESVLRTEGGGHPASHYERLVAQGGGE